MKLSMMSYTMARQGNFDLKKMFELTNELKLDGVDMVTLYNKPASELRQMAADHGVPIVAHTFQAPMYHADAAARQAGVDQAKKGIEAAVELGAPVVMIVTPPNGNEDRNVGRANWIAGLKEVAPFALKAGIVPTIENFPGEFSSFVTAADVLAAITAVPGLKLTFDNGNAGSGENPAESFKRCAAHVVHCHFKDWYMQDAPGEGFRRMLNGRYYKPALIGEGGIDQKGCIKAMEAAGYKGCINIEYESNDYPAADAIRKAVAYLRGLMA